MENFKKCATVNETHKTAWGTPSIKLFNTTKAAEERKGTFDKVVPVVLRSNSKEMSYEEAIEEGYKFKKSHFSVSDTTYDSEREVVFLEAHKYELKDGYTEEDVQNHMEKLWENNRSGNNSEFYKIVD